jgi:hypothetical protein
LDHPCVYNGRPYRFEWEREWRIAGDVRFEPEDVAFLFIPGELHEQARQFSADVKIEDGGPAYACAYDAGWPIERIEEALADVPPLPEPSRNAVPWVGGPPPDCSTTSRSNRRANVEASGSATQARGVSEAGLWLADGPCRDPAAASCGAGLS